MPLSFAAQDTAGWSPATFNGAKIPEMDLATGRLGKTDCHFGLNGDLPVALVAEISVKAALQKLGPRAIDVTVRGGVVAETLWKEFLTKRGPQTPQLHAFLMTFDDIVRRRR